jgi:hypothetical protein
MSFCGKWAWSPPDIFVSPLIAKPNVKCNVKRYLKNLIFAHENMKKQPSKVAHNSQPAIFVITSQAAQKAHFRQK